MVAHHSFRRAPVIGRALALLASAVVVAGSLATVAVVAAPAGPARAADPNYPTIDLSAVLYDSFASAGIVDLTQPPAAGPANPDPASVTATAGSTPLQGASILTSDLTGSELANVKLIDLGLDSLPIQLPLSTIPLARTAAPRSWQDALGNTPLAGVPLQNVTWSQVVNMAARPAIVATLTLAEVDWSGSALRDLPLAAFVFGGSDVTAITIPLQPGEPATDTTNAERWCHLLNSIQGGSCAGPSSLAGKSLIDIGVQGAPLKNIPLKNIPLKNIDLTASPLKNIPLKNIVLEVAPLKNIPLKNIDLASSPLKNIPLKNIDWVSSPLKNIPLKNIDWVSSPLKNIPLKNIDLTASPLKNIPLKNINFDVAPLKNIPLKNIDLTQSGLGALPLAAIAWATAPLGARPVGDFVTTSAPFASEPAGATLGAVAAASGFTSGATLADLVSTLRPEAPGISLGELRLDLAGPTAPALTVGAIVLALQAAGTDPAPAPTVGDLDVGTMTAETFLGDLRLDLIADPPTMVLSELLASLAAVTADVLLGDLRLDLAKDAPLLTLSDFLASLLSINPDVLLGDLRLDVATGVDALVLGDLTALILASYLLGDIGTYTDVSGHDITLGELGTWAVGEPLKDITLGELAQYLDSSVSLADVLLGLVPSSEFPFENFPIASLGLDKYGRKGIAPVPGGYSSPDGFPATLAPIQGISATFGLRNTGSTDFTDPVSVEVVLPPGATLLSFAAGPHAGTQSETTDPDGRTRVVVTEVTVGYTTSSWSFFWLPGLHLVPTSYDIELRAGGAVVASETVPFYYIADGAEPSTPQESLARGLPNIRIPDLPVNPTGCSASADDCLGLDPVYVDTLAPGFIAFAGDVDWYRVKGVRAGSRITADLTNLPLDADLVLYGPESIKTSPTLFDPSAQGLPGQLVEDPGLGVGQAARALAADALNDLQLDPGWIDTTVAPAVPHAPMTPLSISQHSGSDPESVGAIAPVNGDYVVAVSGYNGAFSSDPYLLRTRVFTPTSQAACSARAFPHEAPAPGSIPTIGGGVNAVFLTNPGRLAATYGQTAADGIATKLDALVDHLQATPALGVRPAVVPLDSYPAVASAYTAWDASPCSVSAANEVASHVTKVLADIRATAPDLAYVTVIGGDDIVPMGRIPDLTRVSNEVEYASTFDALNPISAAAKAGYTLTDDMYGDPNPTPVGDGSSLFVPRIAVGRLVETPADIEGQIDSFTGNGGTLDTSTALVAGYDFLADGASAVASRLNTGGRSVDSTLVDAPGTTTPWTTASLLAKLFPANGASPLVDSLNAHYDHTALLSSAGNASGDFDIETAGNIAARSTAGELARRILFTMGCHAGLAVPDAYVAGTDPAATSLKGDWAQTLSHAGVAVYVANTGFGIGDTSSVAYSERLMALYAKLLDGSLTAGQALAYAKQAYYGSLGAVGVYDLKILQQTAFYGLPFWHVSTAPGVTPDPPVAPALPGTIGTDGASGLAAMPLSVTPSFDQVTTPRGRYWAVDGEDPQVTQYRPIQPRTDLSVVTPGQTAHGALITSLVSHDVSDVNPVLSTPTVDLSASSPEVRADDVAWPARLVTITSSQAPYGRAQSLVLVPGQFLGSSDGTGTQRLFDTMGVVVYYAPDESTDFTEPVISAATAASTGRSVVFTVAAIDPNGAGADGAIKRVTVGFHDPDGSWRFVDLAQQGGGPTWSGSGSVSRTLSASEAVEYFVQVLDSAGNVAVANGKAAGFEAPVAPTTGPIITAAINPTPNGAGWVKAASATVTFTCTAGSVAIPDGACPAPQTITTEGTTLVSGSVVDDQGKGATAVATVQLDRTAPTITAHVSPAGWSNGASATVTFTCADGTSGLDTTGCPTPITVTKEGITTVTGTAIDIAGNETSASAEVYLDRTAPVVAFTGSQPNLACTTSDPLSGVASPAVLSSSTVRVGGIPTTTVTCTGATDTAGNTAAPITQTFVAPMTFVGFLSPVDNPPVINSGKAGRTYPVKFQLRDAQGLFITVLGAVTSISARQVTKAFSGSVDALPTTTVAGSGLTYDAATNQYVYLWKTPTDKGPYLLTVTLADGSTHPAEFDLK